MTGPIRNNRGMALLLTVLVISLLMVLVMEFNRTMRSDLQSAANLRDGVKLVYMARTAFNTALAVLHVDGQESGYDSLQETWANLELFSAYGRRFFDEGEIAAQINDLSGRLQINALIDDQGNFNQQQRDLWVKFLTFPEFGLEQGKEEEILDALKDWLDEDNEAELGVGGAENSYYQSLDPPYECRNGPMGFAEELLLVKGIERTLLYGNEEHPGILPYVTTQGTDGMININTADPRVLLTLSDGFSQEMVDDMVAWRQEEDHDLAEVNWYQEVTSIPNDVTIPDGLITTSSHYFEIKATASSAMVSRTISGVVERPERGRPEIVAWKLE